MSKRQQKYQKAASELQRLHSLKLSTKNKITTPSTVKNNKIIKKKKTKRERERDMNNNVRWSNVSNWVFIMRQRREFERGNIQRNNS